MAGRIVSMLCVVKVGIVRKNSLAIFVLYTLTLLLVLGNIISKIFYQLSFSCYFQSL